MDDTDNHKTKGDVYAQQWKALSGWFLGPRAENRDVFKKIFNEVLDKHADVRQSFFPTDPAYITADMRASTEYSSEVEDLRNTLMKMNDELKQSVPFYSPRYQAHMNWDVTMPSLLGYMMAMLHCQNNVDTAASSVTTLYEKAVGLQLCDMLGYNIDDSNKEPKGWGHITCGGSVANIESLWASRNIKFSAVGLLHAVLTAPKEILTKSEAKRAKDYKVKVLVNETITGKFVMTEKAFGDCSKSELLNMDVDEFCNLTNRVARHVGLEKEKLDKFAAWVEENTYAALGDRQFMELHGIKPAVYAVPANCHYSWPKAGTLLGLGSDALIPIPLDVDFRQDVDALREKLVECIEKELPILSVTAVMGSTEESAVDPIKKIWTLRKDLQEEYGINFAILADGAWGGYMKTMVIDQPSKPRNGLMAQKSGNSDFVPFLPLTDYVTEQYNHIQLADTITIDPHKSGFCPYPAGALCYRNGAMRYSIAFLHPEVYHGEDDPTMGVYGIEGSKPGAAPAGVLASHKVIGLNVHGYGRILGQCQMTCKIFYCLWLTLARKDDPFICLPVQQLSEYYAQPCDEAMTRAEFIIKNKILGKSHYEITKSPEAMDLLRECGPDTLINAFVVNPNNPDGTPNVDVERANKLQKALSNSLNVVVGKCNERVPIMIMQSGLNKNHGNALKHFKNRLGLNSNNDTELNVMVNTAMNPWQWNESISALGDIFRTQVLICMGQLDDKDVHHKFVVCGDVDENREVFAEYVPSFDVREKQYHLIVKLKLSALSGSFQRGWLLKSHKKLSLHHFITGKDAACFDLYDGSCVTENLMGRVDMTVVDMPRFIHFDMSSHVEYNEKQQYFLYGDEKRIYMSHCIKKAPDFMQVVELNELPYGLTKDLVELGVVVTIPELNGEPKEIKGEIANPLDNTNFTVKYRGRQYADCESTIYIKNSIMFKPLHHLTLPNGC